MQSNKRNPVPYLLRRYAFSALTTFVIVFFLLPFDGLVRFGDLSGSIQETIRLEGGLDDDAVLTATRYVSSLVRYSSGRQELLTIGFMGLGFLTAVGLFRHLFSRREAMMIAALPVRREEDFLHRLLCAVLTGLLPSAIAVLLYPVFVHVFGLTPYIEKNLWSRLLVLLIMHAYGFSLGALCAALTGQLYACILGAAVLGGGIEIMLLLWQQIAGHYLYTLPAEGMRDLLRLVSPAFSLYKSLLDPETYSILPGILASLLFLALAYVLYRMRRSERAGQTLAFEKSEPVLGVLVSVIGGTVIGYVLFLTFVRELALFISLAGGALLTWLLSRLIFERSSRKLLKGLPIGIACSLALCLCATLIRMDVIGYDQYKPVASQLKQIAVKTGNYSLSNDATVYSQPETLEAASVLGTVLRDNTVGEKGYHLTESPSFHLIYSGKSGTRIRSYGNRTDMIWARQDPRWASAMQTLLESSEYREALLVSSRIDESLSLLTEGKTSQVSFSYYQKRDIGNVSESDIRAIAGENYKRFDYRYFESDKPVELLTALRADLLQRTYAQMQEEPILEINLYGRSHAGEYFSTSIDVYPSDQNALRYLYGENWKAVSDYLCGGFVADTEHYAVYRVRYDAPLKTRLNLWDLTAGAVEWDRLDGDAAVSLVSRAFSQQYVYNFQAAAPDDYEMCWLFNLDMLRNYEAFEGMDFAQTDLMEHALEDDSFRNCVTVCFLPYTE